MEYLDKIFLGDGLAGMKIYPDNGDTVLDNCMGSGTTAIACINTGRHYTGFEKDERYYRVAQKRIAERLKQSST